LNDVAELPHVPSDCVKPSITYLLCVFFNDTVRVEHVAVSNDGLTGEGISGKDLKGIYHG